MGAVLRENYETVGIRTNHFSTRGGVLGKIMPLITRLTTADYEDHKAILKLSRHSPYTKGFGDVRYVRN